jgi:type I restriction enzyme M protein
VSKKKGKAAEADVAAGLKLQERIRAALTTMPDTLVKDREAFALSLDEHLGAADLALGAPVMKAIFAALGERDETAEICRDKAGNPEPDPELRDYENVPLGESVEDYFAREVTPYVADAWINTAVRDEKDGEVGRVGYEINFNRYFYKYVPPRPLDEIQAEIRQVEQEILTLLGQVTY